MYQTKEANLLKQEQFQSEMHVKFILIFGSTISLYKLCKTFWKDGIGGTYIAYDEFESTKYMYLFSNCYWPKRNSFTVIPRVMTLQN